MKSNTSIQGTEEASGTVAFSPRHQLMGHAASGQSIYCRELASSPSQAPAATPTRIEAVGAPPQGTQPVVGFSEPSLNTPRCELAPASPAWVPPVLTRSSFGSLRRSGQSGTGQAPVLGSRSAGKGGNGGPHNHEAAAAASASALPGHRGSCRRRWPCLMNACCMPLQEQPPP